jgi:hypothetical protein
MRGATSVLASATSEQTFDSENAAVLAFERLADQSIADGYFLTDISDRFASELGGSAVSPLPVSPLPVSPLPVSPQARSTV